MGIRVMRVVRGQLGDKPVFGYGYLGCLMELLDCCDLGVKIWW